MSLIHWNPFREMELFNRRFNELFSSPIISMGKGFEWKPSVDIHETPEHFAITAELPGVAKEDVKITVESGILTIMGERKSESETKDKKAHRIERSYGRFERSFALPENVDADNVVAEFKDGVLTMKLMKKAVEPSKIKSIPVA